MHAILLELTEPIGLRTSTVRRGLLELTVHKGLLELKIRIGDIQLLRVYLEWEGFHQNANLYEQWEGGSVTSMQTFAYKFF